MAAALAAFIGALWAGQFLVTTIWGIAFVMGNQGISFERQISRPVLCLSFSLVLSLGFGLSWLPIIALTKLLGKIKFRLVD